MISANAVAQRLRFYCGSVRRPLRPTPAARAGHLRDDFSDDIMTTNKQRPLAMQSETEAGFTSHSTPECGIVKQELDRAGFFGFFTSTSFCCPLDRPPSLR